MSKQPVKPADHREPGAYEIRLRGHLDPRWAARLEVPSLRHESDGTTVIRSVAADQAALHGLLQRLRDLGLPLISVIDVDADRPGLPTNQGEKK
jgi:hypothetical protein